MTGQPNVDHPAVSAALSLLPLGSDEALTSRVRRVTPTHLFLSWPRTGVGEAVAFADRNMLELSWQAEDGLRSVPAESVAATEDGQWKVRIIGEASRLQRREEIGRAHV